MRSEFSCASAQTASQFFTGMDDIRAGNFDSVSLCHYHPRFTTVIFE
jgi:hypothetical protein